MRISDWSSDVCSSDLLTDRLTLHPDWPLDTKVLAAAVRDVIEDQCGPRRYRAVDDLLSGAAPRLNGIDGDILCGGEPAAGAIAAAHAMHPTLLPSHGPTGTGTTQVIGRGACRGRVCPDVAISVVAGSMKKKRNK